MSSNHKQNDEIDLIELFWALWQGKWILILCSIIGFAVAFIYLRTQPRIYQADLLLQVEQKNAGLGGLLGDIDPLLQGGNEIDSQIEILKSRSILSKTVEQFHLTSQLAPIVGFRNILHPVENIPYSQIDFQLSVPESFIPREHKLTLDIGDQNQWTLKEDGSVLFSGRNGERVKKDGYQLFLDSSVDLSGRKFAVIIRSPLLAIHWLQDILSVNAVDKKSLLRLRLDSQDPNYAAELLNSIASDYVISNAEQSSSKLAQGAEFIESQLPGLRHQLEKAEQDLSEFQLKNKAVDLGIESATLIQSLAKIEGELTALELQRNEMASRYTAKHPAMQALYHQKESLLIRKSEIEQKINKLPESSQGIIRLKRDVAVSQSVYLQLLSRLQELNVAKASSVGGVRIIDYAQSDNEIIKPKDKIILFLGLAFGLIFSVVVVSIRYIIRHTIKGIEDVIDNTVLEVSAIIPFSKKQKKLEALLKSKHKHADENDMLAISDSQDLSVEGLRNLRTALHLTMSGLKNNVLMISGPTEDVGKSFISSNLAALIAGTNKRIVLVNADLRKGYMDYQFTLEKNKSTLSDFLNKSDINFDSCVHKTKVDNLYYVPSGKKIQNPAEVLSKEKTNSFIEYLRAEFDLVILDTPPILPVSDALILSRLSSRIILVVRFDKTTLRELKLAQGKLNTISDKKLSVVINGVTKDVKKGYYSYYSDR